MDISNAIASYILKEKKDKPIIVAFDGVDTSGKTTLADNVYKILIIKKVTAVQDNFIVKTPFAKHRQLDYESLMAAMNRKTKYVDQYAGIMKPIFLK